MSYVENAYIQEEVLRELPLTHVSGIAPNDPQNVSIILTNGTAYISFRVPDIMIDNRRICTTQGAVILRKAAAIPNSPTDGVIIGKYTIAEINNSSMVPIEDTGLLLNVPYYYWIIPYSDHGVFNYRENNIHLAIELENAFYYHEYTISSLPATINDSGITSDMVVLQAELSNPKIALSNWQYTTSNGGLSITGSKASGNVTAKLLLGKKDSEFVYSTTITFSALPYTHSNAKIKDSMVLAEAVITSGKLPADIDYQTNDGSFMLTGTSPSSSVTMEVTFVLVNSVTTVEREYTIGALPYVVENDPYLKSTMHLAEAYFTNPQAATSDWTLAVTDGGLTVTGDISGTTKLRLLLVDIAVATIEKPYIYREYSISSLPYNVSDTGITSNMYLAQAELSNPAAQTGDWTITCGNETLNVAGSISGTTTLKLLLANTAVNTICHKQYQITSLPHDVNDIEITSDMVVAEAWASSGTISSDLTITTRSGGINIAGTYSSAFTLDLILIEKNPVTYLEREYTIGALPYAAENDEYIKANMKVAQAELSNPSAQTSDWTVTTSNGGLTVSGSISGSTRLKLQLAQPSS